ncbi:equilibrative nucleoside transporter family protein (macronuclear) [Tetrahymena thermophila SB210]|uniref:Equilibrative nucleoside transporter family protein n=1 Tax=Tetrahymena thermophila (strain SB210) TaxID=312017 RepID=Q24G88_TETTS|nr:equilibrative nucleoside transporter family protein [Tetrahymena thermophila SB210]EAS06842.2 equilibrative nucleoside transporter family protein [Tetrahymena thermophila SB210]|eukprot:XP_001027084.2 equilibrative nucleoside transporter family protein [Tetrahymena thermophila SB210]
MEKTKLLEDKFSYQTTFLSKITSALLGISTLIAWSAILNSFDFFLFKYPKEIFHDVTFLFPIPLRFATFIWGLAMGKIYKKYSIKINIGLSLLIQSLLIVILVITAQFIENVYGLIICMVLCFIIGTFNCISQNCSIAFISQFDKSNQGIFWIFTSLSGLSMNFARVVILAICGKDEDGITKRTLTCFIIACLIIYATIFSLFKFLKSEQNNQYSHSRSTSTTETVVKSTLESQSEEITIEFTENEQIQSKPSFKSCLKSVRYIALFLFTNYVISFMLFPGVSIYQKRYSFIDSLAWSSLIMQILFNLGDFFGKIVSSFHFYSSVLLYTLTILRGIFFYTFLMSAREPDNQFFRNDYFAMVDIFIFGLTHGFVASGLMQIGAKKSSNLEEKNIISFILAFFFTLGLSAGTFLALILEEH